MIILFIAIYNIIFTSVKSKKYKYYSVHFQEKKSKYFKIVVTHYKWIYFTGES